MARKKRDNDNNPMNRIYARKVKAQDRLIFEKCQRFNGCLAEFGGQTYPLNLDENNINNVLSKNCSDVEQQMIALRRELQLTNRDIEYRVRFTKSLLSCLYRHHEIVYQGILFGSTVNGLGHRDSDVDLRLRPIAPASRENSDLYEPISMNDEFIDRILKNIAFRTTVCSQAVGEFVPSKRCPIAKLKFYASIDASRKIIHEGLSFDISLSPFSSLGSFNSRFLRFLCKLEPKFHILALTLRHWSKTQNLIQAGLFSSYALINMLIFFCQMTSPPLLPTVDMMRETYFEHKARNDSNNNHNKMELNGIGIKTSPPTWKALTQVESQCLVCLHEERYIKSHNQDPLSLVLLKFFEFYLNFPYSTHIITIRPGRALTKQEFQKTTQFNPRFPIKNYLNIQDPFDMKHNLTSGMDANHFYRIMTTIMRSYETLYQEVLNDLSKPQHLRGRGYNERKVAAEQQQENVLREISKCFKRFKGQIYTLEPLDRRDVLKFLDVCQPYCDNNNDFKRIQKIVNRPGEDIKTAEQALLKKFLKDLVRDVRRIVQGESKWGLTTIFTPLVREGIKLPRIQNPKDQEKNIPTTSQDSKDLK